MHRELHALLLRNKKSRLRSTRAAVKHFFSGKFLLGPLSSQLSRDTAGSERLTDAFQPSRDSRRDTHDADGGAGRSSERRSGRDTDMDLSGAQPPWQLTREPSVLRRQKAAMQKVLLSLVTLTYP